MTTPDTSWLRKANPLIWAAVITVGGIAAVTLTADKPVYEAHAAVELAPNSDLFLDNDAVVLKAARQAGLHTDPEFSQPPGNASLVANAKGHLALRNNGQFVQISVTAHDPQKAAAFASALIDAYNDELNSRHLARAAEFSTGLDALQSLIEQQETQLTARRLTAANKQAILAELDRNRELYDTMLRRTAALPSPQSRFADRAQIPTEPINSNPWTGLAIAVPLTLLGALLFFVSRSRMQQQPLPFTQADVMCSQQEIEKPVVAVTNAGTGYINPETLLDYVENLLSTGNTVLIIDCELGGALTESVGLRGEYGLSDFLMDSPTLRGAIPAWKTNRKGVAVMPAGTRPNRLPSLLNTPHLREALAVLLAKFDRVVINAPPVLTTGEMRDLSPLVDGVILVTAHDRSMNLAHLAVRQVEEFGGNVIGLVEDPNQLAVL